MKRRKFSELSSSAGLAMLLGNYSCHAKDKSSAVAEAILPQKKDPFFKLPLAQWSLNKEIPKNIAHAEDRIKLQDHSNPVSYRNIWIRKL